MRLLLRISLIALLLWAAANACLGLLLPDHLLKGPMPRRTEADRSRIRAELATPGTAWTRHDIPGGEGRPLQLWWLHRTQPKGVALILHGFGDDAWGTAPRLRDLPDLDAVVFTLRGRDLHPEVPSTLGAFEAMDIEAAVRFIEGRGVPRQRIVLVAVSQSAGAALLGLRRLETGGPLGGALLESPWRDLRDAARNHLRGTLGAAELLLRPAEELALARAGRIAGFRAREVSPLEASQHLTTPIALLAGDADVVTPLAGVRRIAAHHPDLTIAAGAGHCESAGRLPGGWRAWAEPRLRRWGF
jgi:pimeloyl-ACP methyl ester carboxylesterase